MNQLEIALAQSDENASLEFYLEVTPLSKIREDIEEIKRKAADQGFATQKLQAIKSILEEHA